jgi:hypothetical protein
MEVAPDTRVCPKCGEAAGDRPFCASCGLNLTRVTQLPTHGQWEDAQGSPPDTSAAKSLESRIFHGFNEWRSRQRPVVLAAIASIIAIVIVVAVVVIASSGGPTDRTAYVESYLGTDLGVEVICFRSSDTIYRCGERELFSEKEDPNGSEWEVVLDSSGNVATYNQTR